MYIGMKNTLKSNCNHTPKRASIFYFIFRFFYILYQKQIYKNKKILL
jgi:hypothetical protein